MESFCFSFQHSQKSWWISLRRHHLAVGCWLDHTAWAGVELWWWCGPLFVFCMQGRSLTGGGLSFSQHHRWGQRSCLRDMSVCCAYCSLLLYHVISLSVVAIFILSRHVISQSVVVITPRDISVCCACLHPVTHVVHVPCDSLVCRVLGGIWGPWPALLDLPCHEERPSQAARVLSLSPPPPPAALSDLAFTHVQASKDGSFLTQASVARFC